MASFRLGRPGGGSYLAHGDLLAGPEAAALAASLTASLTVSASLTTAIRVAAAATATCTVVASLTTSIPLQAAAAAEVMVSGTLSDYIIPLAPDRALRTYEQFIQGPADAPLYSFGTVDAHRAGAQFTANLSSFFEPEEGGASPDFGFLGGNSFEVEIASTATSPLDLAAVGTALRDQVLKLDQVTRFAYSDGSTSETTNTRRAVVKKVARKRNILSLEMADIDRSALDAVYPLQAFTVADFPNLFSGHVGRLITEGVGTVIRVPLTWIDNAGPHVFAGPRVIDSAGALLAVYRGTSEGQGAVVDAAEYTVGTVAGAVSGVVVNTVSFDKEQVDFPGSPFVLEADYRLPGSRIASDQIARILAAYGRGTNAPSFELAAAFDSSNGLFIDALFGGGSGRTGNATIEDLLRMARGWLVPTESGDWAIAQDRPQLPIMLFDATNDEIDVSQYGDGDRLKTVKVEYRPRRAGLDSDLASTIVRTTGAATGELDIKAPFLWEHGVADRLASYHQKRMDAPLAEAKTRAVQLDIGSVIAIAAPWLWSGRRNFIIEGNRRGADSNALSLREVADLYTYVAGPLPADATNGYGPDYRFTSPEPPADAAYVSGGTRTDIDGKVRAFALVHATPPAVNWAKLTAQAVDPVTKEQHTAQLSLNGATGFYEGMITDLPPNRDLQLLIWATNANNRDGYAAGPINFTSATDPNVPAAPASALVTQNVAKEMHYAWTQVTAPAGSPPIEEYIVEESVNNSSYAEIWRGKTISLERVGTSTGNSYKFRVRAKNKADTEGPTTTSNQVTSGTTIDDSYIVGQGVSGGSIANGSINRSRSNTGTGSATGSVGANTGVGVVMDTYTFAPNVMLNFQDQTCPIYASPLGGTGDRAQVSFYNTFPGNSYDVEWRKFLP